MTAYFVQLEHRIAPTVQRAASHVDSSPHLSKVHKFARASERIEHIQLKMLPVVARLALISTQLKGLVKGNQVLLLTVSQLFTVFASKGK